MATTTSSSVSGKAVIEHEAGDTLRRTITISTGGTPVNLTGSTIQVIISATKDGTAVETLTVGDGLLASNLSSGEFKIHFQTSGVFTPGSDYFYKVKVTDSAGVIKTYLEDKIKFK